MSDHPTHPDAATDLDASVDALTDQLGSDAAAGNAHAASVATLDAPPIPNPPTDHAPDAASHDALLSEISAEIERTAPGPLPTPPEPPPVAIAPTPAPLPTPEDIAAAAADVDADLDAFEPPTTAEIAPAFEAAPLPTQAPASAPIIGAVSAKPASAASTPDRPGPEIQRLDAALAAGAERALATAAREATKEVPKPAPTPEPEAEFEPELPEAPSEPIVVPVAPAPTPAPAKTEPKPVTVAIIAEPVAPPIAPAPNRLRPMLTKALAVLLRPLVVLHEKFAEPTRQTIGYCAIITLFFAACVWGRVIFFPVKANLEPHGHAAEFYDDTTPAHGTTAPAKHGAEATGGHGDAGHGDSGHGEAKKPDAHAKPEKKKSSDGHGDDAHAKAKPEKKSSSKKKTASADAHGGH